MAHSRRVAGTIYFQINGDLVPARGSFEYRLSGTKNESIPNADGSTSIGGSFNDGYIKGNVANYRDVNHKAIKEAEGVTVTLQLANDKVIIARDAFQTDECVVNVETGEFPVELHSDNVEETR